MIIKFSKVSDLQERQFINLINRLKHDRFFEQKVYKQARKMNLTIDIQKKYIKVIGHLES